MRLLTTVEKRVSVTLTNKKQAGRFDQPVFGNRNLKMLLSVRWFRFSFGLAVKSQTQFIKAC
jgi:hypothetical protein